MFVYFNLLICDFFYTSIVETTCRKKLGKMHENCKGVVEYSKMYMKFIHTGCFLLDFYSDWKRLRPYDIGKLKTKIFIVQSIDV